LSTVRHIFTFAFINLSYTHTHVPKMNLFIKGKVNKGVERRCVMCGRVESVRGERVCVCECDCMHAQEKKEVQPFGRK